jgi:cysteine desulfurase
MGKPEYFDFAATTPVDARVAELMMRYLCHNYGNAGSRTHSYGVDARNAVEQARSQVAALVSASDDEVIFTSGATEANNIGILGLAEYGVGAGRKHIVTSAIEHKAVLEPVQHLAENGFDVSVLPVGQGGVVDPADLRAALRPDTLLVTVMHVNNETGVIQPLDEFCRVLSDHPAYFHVDAAQGFGKERRLLHADRIDLISISGHKIYGPQGTGALVSRKRNGSDRVPLRSLMLGGGQERGIRPGTVSVPLAVALGEAARLAEVEAEGRQVQVMKIAKDLEEFIDGAGGVVNGDRKCAIPQIVNASFHGLDSEAFIVATKEHIAISNGAACSSHSYERSHVLEAMGLVGWRINGAVRFSFSHTSCSPDWRRIAAIVESVRF